MTTLDFDVSKLKRSVEAYPYVHSLDVSTEFPHGVTIDVLEEVPVAVTSVAGRVTVVDADGEPPLERRHPPRPAAIGSARLGIDGWRRDWRSHLRPDHRPGLAGRAQGAGRRSLPIPATRRQRRQQHGPRCRRQASRWAKLVLRPARRPCRTSGTLRWRCWRPGARRPPPAGNTSTSVIRQRPRGWWAVADPRPQARPEVEGWTARRNSDPQAIN